MSCRHAKKEIQALSGACWRILATEKGDEPVVVFARDLRAVLVMLAALGGDETKRGELNR